MNTIRKPRKRPRRKSYSFSTLGWLIRREASFRIVYRTGHCLAPHSGARAVWVLQSTEYRERWAEQKMADEPQRRFV